MYVFDGPSHVMLELLLWIGVTVTFLSSGKVVEFAEIQEQGFGRNLSFGDACWPYSCYLVETPESENSSNYARKR